MGIRLKSVLLSLFMVAAANAAVTVTYQEDNSNFCNPERGIFHHLEFRSSKPSTMTDSYLAGCRGEGISLLFNVYVLDNCRDGNDLPQSVLDMLDANMEALRRNGLKTVLRFCYSYGENDYPRDMPWEVTERHIDQLAPHLRANSDVIALLEAGFIGSWGEWYYTDNYGFEPRTFEDYAARRRLLAKLHEVLPADRFVAVRYPAAKTSIFGRSLSEPMTADEAFGATDYARTAFHNDCFLANADHMGTGLANAVTRDFLAAETQFVPMGGETCTDPNQFTEYGNALTELKRYHWSYLNEDYHPGTISAWEESGLLAETRRNLGYRFRLEELKAVNFRPGATARVRLRLTNVGYAAPYNPRKAIFVLASREGSQEYFFEVDSDMRTWQPGEIMLESALELPADIAEGKYRLYLWMPDAASSLADRAEFAVRLANTRMWESKTGRNILADIDVEAGPEESLEPVQPPVADEYDLLSLVWRGNSVADDAGNVTSAVKLAGGFFGMATDGDRLLLTVCRRNPANIASVEVKGAAGETGPLSASRAIDADTETIAYDLDSGSAAFIRDNGVSVAGVNFILTGISIMRKKTGALIAPAAAPIQARSYDMLGRPADRGLLIEHVPGQAPRKVYRP